MFCTKYDKPLFLVSCLYASFVGRETGENVNGDLAFLRPVLFDRSGTKVKWMSNSEIFITDIAQYYCDTIFLSKKL
jgi:hypothetical protein